jgi:hypothetical protein
VVVAAPKQAVVVLFALEVVAALKVLEVAAVVDLGGLVAQLPASVRGNRDKYDTDWLCSPYPSGLVL